MRINGMKAVWEGWFCYRLPVVILPSMDCRTYRIVSTRVSAKDNRQQGVITR